jgi:signal transduction histidine kinase
MNALEGCPIAVVVRSEDPSAQVRIEALRRAGAAVCVCAPNRDLWLTLSEGLFDAIVLLSERSDPESLAMHDQLRENARTRGVPLLVTGTAGPTTAHHPLVLAGQSELEAFVSAVADLVIPIRRLRSAEQLERTLREQLRTELVRSARGARELSELGHELRAMFGAAIGFACNLRDGAAGPLLPDQRSHVMGILDAVHRANRLLEKSASEAPSSLGEPSMAPASAPPRAQRTVVQLARIASEAVALFEGVARRKAIRVRCTCDETVSIWGDALKLKQVVANLLVNALKYTHEGGEVSVQIGWSNPPGVGHVHARRAAELVVTDTGPGIAPVHRERIFERGFRIDQSSSVEGQGIGLALVREIVLQHGGSIGVEGEHGAGAVFRVSLPQDRRHRARSGALGESDTAFAAVSLVSLVPSAAANGGHSE